ncbi:MAG: hypothetical protein K0R54_1779 [Clostridiaceae bacterium]|jgi:hypothetical protein|nr:hypothetical protein [Clostridiaceae bacterium]
MKINQFKKAIAAALFATIIFSSGVFASSAWTQTNGKWTYTEADGTLAKEWRLIGGKWYYFESDGTMAVEWKSIQGADYYLNPSGDMAIGWKQIGSSWYYFNSNGQMVCSNWVGNYYLQLDGKMAVSTITPDGYHVDATGAWDGKDAIIIDKNAEFFLQLSDVPMPKNATNYDVSTFSLPNGNTAVTYLYASSSLPDNFQNDYVSLLEEYGWKLSATTTSPDGHQALLYVKGEESIGIGFNGNKFAISGIAH